jgi:hypothetical protein
MRFNQRLPWPALLLVLLFLPSCDKSPAPTESAGESSQEAVAPSRTAHINSGR